MTSRQGYKVNSKHIRKIILILFTTIFIIGLSGCGNRSSSSTQTKTISGYVIDGPIANATIKVYDENGTLLTREENATDSSGHYNIKIKSDSSIVKIIAIPKDGTSLIAYANLDKNSETYITQYTTALIDDAINENKNSKDTYFSLFNKLAFSQGKPTNKKGYDFQKIDYIASKIHTSFANKIPYYIYNDTNLTIIPKTLEAGSVIDFSLDGYDNLICNNTSAVTILNNTRLSVSENLNKAITINCIAKGKGKLGLYSIALTPTNATIKDMNASQKSISVNGIQINKPSNDSIQVQNANNAPILLKNNSNIIVGNTLLNFYPNGKVLKQPLIVKIPSTEQNQTFYLLSKDGSLEKADSTYSNGIYDVTVPHFTKLIQINDNIVQTSTNIVNNKDYKSIKNLLIEKDKKYYTFSDSLSYPSLLTSHGYSEDDLQNNINVESLLEILLLHNGQGIIDFDGTNINFNGGTLKFGMSGSKDLEKDADSQETSLIINVWIKLLQLQVAQLSIEEAQEYIKKNKAYLSQLKSKDIYNKTLKDLYNNMKKNMKAYNAYRKKLNDIELEYQRSSKKYTDIKNALDKYDQLANLNNKASYGQGYNKYAFARMDMIAQQRLLENLTGKSLEYINVHREDFLKSFEKEVQKTKTDLDGLKTNSSGKILNEVKSLVKDFQDGKITTNRLSLFLQKSKNFQLVEPKESNVGDISGKIFGVVGIAFKVWDSASTYDFKEIDNKIKFLNHLEVDLPTYKKDIDNLKTKLIWAKWNDEHYIGSVYAYCHNAVANIPNFGDMINDVIGGVGLFKTPTSFVEKKILRGKMAFATLASIADILDTAGQAVNTWQGLNGLAYMSTTASTLAYQLSQNSKLTHKEQLDWYCLFQTVSAGALRSWYFYAADKAININKSYGLYVLGNILDAGLRIVSNPKHPQLGLADAAFNAVLSKIYVSMAAQTQHGIDTGITHPFHGYASLVDKQISDIVSRTAEYKNIVNGVFDSVFSHKRALIVPITQITQLPNGNKLFSFYIKGNDLDNIAIRFDRKDSNTYMEDIANNTFTEAAEKGYYLNWNNIYTKYMFGNNAPQQSAGLVLHPNQKNGTLVTVAVGRNVNRVEILGWRKGESIKDTIPYSHTINIKPTLNIDSSRINNIENNLLDKIEFNDPNNQNNLKYLLSNNFTIINLDNNTSINDLQTLSKTTNWIALKYYNSQMYSIALLKDKNKLYYFIRDNIFNENSGDIGKLFGGSADFVKMFTLKYPIASLVDDIDVASRGAFSAINLDDLFPNLEKGIKNIESLYKNNQPIIKDHKIKITDKSIKLTIQATDPDDDSLTCKVNFGDGTIDEKNCSSEFTHTYAKTGHYTILMTAQGPKGVNSHTAYDNVSITTSPVAKIATSKTTITKGETISLDGSMSSDSDGNIVNYIWSNNAGEISGCKDKSVCKVTPNATTKYTLKVVDDKGLYNEANVTINVKSAIPTITLDAKVQPSTITLSSDETLSDKSITLYVTTNADSSTCDISIDGKPIGMKASQFVCAAGTSGVNIELANSHETMGINTIKVTVKDSNGKEYSKSISFDIVKQKPDYKLSFLGENYKDGTTIKVSDQDTISKYWTIKNISNHSAHLILEKDSAKTCNLNLLTTTNNTEEFDLSSGESNKFIQNYKMPTKDGTYTCYYKIKDSKGNYYKIGNASDISINVKIVSNPLLVNTDFDSEIKVGSSATLAVQINDGNAPYNYKIDWGDTQTTDISNSNTYSTFSHNYNSVGTYTVKVNITDKTGKVYSKTYILKVSKNVSKITKWSGYVDAVKNTGNNTGDITKNITIANTTYNKEKVNEYSIAYTKKSNDKLYYTGYKLPVPQGLINLDHKVRVTFVTKIDTTTGFWNYDREFWLKTNRKKYGSVIEDARDGLNDNGVFIVKNLVAGTRTDTNESNFIDFVVDNKGVSTYALEMDRNAITTYRYTKGSDGNYAYKSIHSYADDTGDYLSQIDVDFKGSGDIILAYLQYDKNGNGKFDNNESIILNSADGSVDWSKLFSKTNTPDQNITPQTQYTLFPGHYPGMWANTNAFAALKSNQMELLLLGDIVLMVAIAVLLLQSLMV